MMNKKDVVIVLTALLLSGFAAPALAGSATTTFTVTATVNPNCTISAANLGFGNYDPLVANLAAPLNATSTVTVACVKGTTATIGLNAGLNSAQAVATTRAMSSGGLTPSFLSYEIYKDVNRTLVWGNAGLTTVSYTAASNANSIITDYGQVPAAQTPPTGSYTDTITATINF